MSYCNTEFLNEEYKILERSQETVFPIIKVINGYEIIINQNVFDPGLFPGGDLFGKMLPIKKGTRFLEVGCGTGIVSLVAAERGASNILCLDISEDAVNNTKENAARHGYSDVIKTRVSDVFDALKEEERFDVIFWNVPFSNVPPTELSKLQRTVADCDYTCVKRFIGEGMKYLTPGGELTFGYSTTVGNLSVLEDFAKTCGLEIKLLEEEEIEVDVNLGIKMSLELFEIKRI